MNPTNIHKNKTSISKVYKCKNFQYTYIKINKTNKSKYSLNFYNKNKNLIENKTYQKNIPESLYNLFKMNINETKKGFITEITCINSYTY